METPSVVIPHASTIVQRYEEHLKKTQEKLEKIAQEHQEKLRKASDAYYHFLIQKCLEAIEEMKEKYTVSATLSNIHQFTYEDVPRDTLHYGTATDTAYKYKPLIEGEDMPFVKAQKKMYEHGYYLLEIQQYDDYQEECDHHITLHATRPSYLDNPYPQWHGYNVLSFLQNHQ